MYVKFLSYKTPLTVRARSNGQTSFYKSTLLPITTTKPLVLTSLVLALYMSLNMLSQNWTCKCPKGRGLPGPHEVHSILVFASFKETLILFQPTELSQRVDGVKEENVGLKSENHVREQIGRMGREGAPCSHAGAIACGATAVASSSAAVATKTLTMKEGLILRQTQDADGGTQTGRYTIRRPRDRRRQAA